MAYSFPHTVLFALGLYTSKDMTGGVSLCLPHECQLCGAMDMVNPLGTHSLHCGKSMGRHPRHTVVNDLIKRSLASTKISAHLEPVGICQADGKRPDGASVMPWRSGRVLVWDTWTHMHHLTCSWLPWKQVQWQTWLSR